MENEFGTPGKEELVRGVPSPNGNLKSDVQTPPAAEEMRTPSPEEVLKEQQSNIMMKPPTNEEGGLRGSHPDPVKVPLGQQKHLWGFPGRYMSPTDRIMSPVSQTLLARNRRVLLPPSLAFSPPPKVLDGTCKDFGPCAP